MAKRLPHPEIAKPRAEVRDGDQFVHGVLAFREGLRGIAAKISQELAHDLGVDRRASALQFADGGAADPGALREVLDGQPLALSKEPKTASKGGVFGGRQYVQAFSDGFLDTKLVTR